MTSEAIGLRLAVLAMTEYPVNNMIFSSRGILRQRTEKALFLSAADDAAFREEKIAGLLKDGIDLGYLVKLAHEGGVAPLVHNALRSYQPSNDAEKKALRHLRVSYLTASAANSHYKKELINILSVFGERGVDVIPLKGLALSRRLYGDVTNRDMSVDTDLLVREGDRDRARFLLEEMGYAFTPVDEREEYKWYHAFNKPGQRMVELHWDITMMVRSSARIEGLWRGTEYSTWDGVRYLDFKPEELLLYLSAHLVNSDSFRKLRYVCDINRVIRKYQGEISWDSLIQKAKDWRMSGALYACLALDSAIFGDTHSAALARRLGLSRPKRLFIRTLANRKVILKKNSLRRKFLDNFLSYILLECAEASSAEEYSAILTRLLR